MDDLIGEEMPDVETKIIALKSNADPNEYLSALNEIEAEIAEEAKIDQFKKGIVSRTPLTK